MRKLAMALSVVVLALVIPARSQAEASKSFAQLRDKARPVVSLADFLSKFIGDCGSDPFTAKDCKQKVDAFRRQALGQTYYVILPDDAQKLVQQRGFNPSTKEMNFALTPYFEAAGYALTESQPRRVDAEGRPIIPLMRMPAILPDNVLPMDVDRLFRTNGVRMQIVFKPEGIWRLPRKGKGGGFIEGVKSKITAVRLSEARTGGDVVTYIADR